MIPRPCSIARMTGCLLLVAGTLSAQAVFNLRGAGVPAATRLQQKGWMEMKITMPNGGKVLTTQSDSKVSVIVSSVDAAGNITEAAEQMSATLEYPDHKKAEFPHQALRDTSVIFTRKEGAWTYRLSEAELDSQTSALIQSEYPKPSLWRDDLPEQGVTTGQRWTLTPDQIRNWSPGIDAFLATFPGAVTGDIACTLDKVETVDGVHRATIPFKGVLKAPATEGGLKAPSRITLEGTRTVRLDLGVTTRIEGRMNIIREKGDPQSSVSFSWTFSQDVNLPKS